MATPGPQGTSADGTTPGAQADASAGDLITPGGASAGPASCSSPCRPDQVCANGSCVDVPKTCPCPVETYCDLETGSCKVGCTDDSTCSTGRICDMARRECNDGCREDGQCGTGKICEALTCRSGCRKDDACGVDSICDALTCRPGCRKDPDCAASQYCDMSALACKTGCRTSTACPTGQWCDFASGHACTTCADAFEPNETQATQTEWSVTQGSTAAPWNATVCASRDHDYSRVTLQFTSTSFSSATIDVVVTAADPTAVLRIDAYDETGDPAFAADTYYVTGTGTVRVHNITNGRCAGTCRPLRMRLHMSTTWPKPIAYRVLANAT